MQTNKALAPKDVKCDEIKKDKKFDIYFLQDEHFQQSMEKLTRSEWGY